MVGSELTLTSPNPPVLPDPFSSCSLSLESFLQVDSHHQFFSRPGTSRSRSWVRRTAAGAGSLPVPFLQGRARGVEVALGGSWELASPVSTFPVSSLPIPAINSKYGPAPGPTMSMFLAFL